MPNRLNLMPGGGGGAGADPTRVWDGTTIANVIAALNALKIDLSGVAGTATAVNAGNVSAGVQRVTVATDDVNLAAIKTAIEIIDNFIGTHDAAAPAGIGVIGGFAESTVPAAVADGDAVRAWLDLLGRLVIYGANMAQASIDVSDTAPAQMQCIEPQTLLSAVTATGASAAVNAQDYENIVTHFIATSTNGAPSYTMELQTSLDNAAWVTAGTLAVSDLLAHELTVSSYQVKYARINVTVYASGSITGKLTAGN